MSQWYWQYAYPAAPKPAEPAPPNTPTTYIYQPRYSQPAPAAPPSNAYSSFYSGPYQQQLYYQQMTYPTSPTQNPQPTHAPAAPQPQVYQYQPGYSNPHATPPINNPDNHPIWYGATKAEIDEGNIQIAQRFGGTAPQAMIPANPDPAQQYMCYEFDGTWTLRRKAEIMEDLQPGYWGIAPNGGPYFVRQKPA
ncbi:MAG: hypothetical protein M1836_000748 [Candelina mexicana]|nr:MAG: hypothetical protein M1836_000748 [Candelina mexicana]